MKSLFIVIVMFVAAGTAVGILAQVVKGAEPNTVEVPELIRYKLKANVAELKTANTEMELLFTQWKNANPEARKKQEVIDNLQAEQRAIVAEAFKVTKLDSAQYFINGDKMQFEKVKK